MLDINKVVKAIADLCKEEFQGETFYDYAAPQTPQRPSVQVGLTKAIRKSIGASLLEDTCHVTVTCYPATIEGTEICSGADLSGKLERVMDLFRKGDVSVEGRRVKIIHSEAVIQSDRSWVTMQFQYREDRDTGMEEMQPMLDIEIKNRQKGGN